MSLRGKGSTIEEARRVRNAAIVADAATMTNRQLETKYGIGFTGITYILEKAGVKAVYDRSHEGKNIIYNWKKKKVRLGNETHLSCTKCDIEKPIDEFGATGFICKKCASERATKWNRENKERRREITAKHHEANREKKNAATRDYYHRTPEKQRTKRKKYQSENRTKLTQKAIVYVRERKRRDPKFAALLTCKRRMWILFKGVGKKKNLRSAELLGIDRAGFFAHIESLFQPGMTWANRGRYGWHIDHKKPCALHDMTDPEQAKACWHYTNLQPMWHTDNLRKGKKYVEKDIDGAENQAVPEAAVVERSAVPI